MAVGSGVGEEVSGWKVEVGEGVSKWALVTSLSASVSVAQGRGELVVLMVCAQLGVSAGE